MTSSRQKIAVGVAAILAVGLLGFATARDRTARAPEPVLASGTVTVVPSKRVDVVDLTTPAQAAIAVSNRLFASADLAVLTAADATPRAAAVEAATRLKVPILLDDPAAPAELTRLRATTVLTFGTTTNVVGAIPAKKDPAALAGQLADLQAEQPTGSPAATGSVVLMKSTTRFDVAAASAAIGGAAVLQSTKGDLRLDPTTAAALARRPADPVIALGAPFADTFAYSLAVVQKKATQIGGGYLALPERRFVGLHGRIGNPASGMLGQQNTQASIRIIKQAAGRFAAQDSLPVVPMFEIVATSAADLEPVVDAAEKAGVYVLIDLQPGRSSLLTQAQAYSSLLKRKNVGLTLEPAVGAEAGVINQVSTWLADLTAANALPQKLLIVRERSSSTITDRGAIDTTHPELSVVLGIDVAGHPATKLAAWSAARSGAPRGAAFGWMQYKKQDRPLFTINRTYKLIRPYPSVITYQ